MSVLTFCKILIKKSRTKFVIKCGMDPAITINIMLLLPRALKSKSTAPKEHREMTNSQHGVVENK